MKSIIAKQLSVDLISYSISFDTDETYGVISNMQLTGGTPAEVNDIKVVRFCDKYKGQAINIRLDTRPDLAALAAEYEQLVTARNAIRTAKHAAEKAAQDAIDNELLDVMNAKAATLIAQIPADHVRVTVKKIGDADGDPILEYAANGVKLGWHDVTIIGWASAIRPGALGSFAEICVASIDREKLEQIRTAQQASTIAKQAAKESREKELQETAIPQYAIDAYNHYHGDADAAWEDENEGDWAMIEKWAPYIEAQHGMNPKKMHKIISESSRETNYGIND